MTVTFKGHLFTSCFFPFLWVYFLRKLVIYVFFLALLKLLKCSTLTHLRLTLVYLQDAGVHALSNVCHVDVERISKRKPGDVVLFCLYVFLKNGYLMLMEVPQHLHCTSNFNLFANAEKFVIILLQQVDYFLYMLFCTHD